MAVEIDRAWPVHTSKPSGVQNSLALAGLVTRNADGTVRTGIFPPPYDARLVQARADMKVTVLPFQAVSSRPGQGAVLIGNGATRVVPIAAAPSANARIDVVYAQAQDGAPPNSDPLYADPVNTGTDPYTGKPFQYSKTIIDVATGVAAGVPTKPSLPAGAVEIATIRVASGATATNADGVAIAQTFQYAAAQGGPIWYRTVDEMRAGVANVAAGSMAYVQAQDAFYLLTAGTWQPIVRGWNLLAPSRVVGGQASIAGSVNFSGASSVQLDGVFSQAFTHYKIVIDVTGMSAAGQLFVRLASGGTVDTSATYDQEFLYGSGGSATAASFKKTDSWQIGVQSSRLGHNAEITLWGPAHARLTSGQSSGTDFDYNDDVISSIIALGTTSTKAYDGLSIFVNGGAAMTGSVRVYGVYGG